MYSFKTMAPETEGAAPALAIVTTPENLERVSDAPWLISDLAGKLGVREFVMGGERFGFGGVGVVSEVSDEEAVVTLTMPPQKVEEADLLEATATIHAVCNVLNLVQKSNRWMPEPPLAVATQVSRRTHGEHLGHTMRVDVAFNLIRAVAEAKKAGILGELVEHTEQGLKVFDNYFYPRSVGASVNAIFRDTDDLHLTSYGAAGLDTVGPEGSPRMMIGHNIDRPTQQITLLAGVASMGEWLSEAQLST